MATPRQHKRKANANEVFIVAPKESGDEIQFKLKETRLFTSSYCLIGLLNNERINGAG
jgi:hypothetical protein